MAVLNVPNRMVYWEIYLSGEDSTVLLKNVVATFSITYEVNKITIASISIMSQNYMENFFSVGQSITIKLGFSPLDMTTMFTGKIHAYPNGDASDHLSYNVIAHSTEAALALKELNKMHLYKTKSNIIRAICKESGLSIKKIQIEDDKLPIIQHAPMQGQQTMLEFLTDCAEKWGCEYFITEKKKKAKRPTFTSLVADDLSNKEIVFCDRNDLYKQGDNLYKQKREALFTNSLASGSYILGYRTNSSLNNIAKISWKFKPPKNKQSSTFVGTNEKGEKASKYAIDSYNTKTGKYERWELKGKHLKEVKKDKRVFGKYLKLVFSNSDYGDKTGYGSFSNIKNREALIKYFVRKSVGSKTDSYKHGNGDTLDITVELNIGDPELRPIRTAILKHGSLDANAVSAFLPQWLWSKKENPTFNIYKVTTALSNGKISTILQMKRD